MKENEEPRTPADEGRRSFLKSSASFSALGLSSAAIAMIFNEGASAQDRTRSDKEKPPVVEAVKMAISRGDSKVAVERYGAKLTPKQKEVLTRISPKDLELLKELQTKYKDLGAVAETNGGVFW